MMWASGEVHSIPLELSDLTDQELIEVRMQIIQKDGEIGDLKEDLVALRNTMKAMHMRNERQQLEATPLVV